MERYITPAQKLLESRIIMLDKAFDQNMASRIVTSLLYLDSESQEDISIYINSPGGSVTAGLAIYDTMNLIKSDVQTICFGMACSMGAFILSGGTPGKRKALKHAEIMIHQVSSGARGTITDMEISFKQSKYFKDLLNELLSKHTGHSVKKVAADCERDYFMTSQDALKYNLIDEVL